MKQWLYVYMQWLLRELRMRYRASAVGGGWLILQPVVHIMLFTLVFYQFFQVRWPVGDGSATEYGLQVFIGLSLYTFVADVINRAPASVWSYPYLVTKVRFPVEMLPVVQVGAAGLQLVLALLVTLPFMLWRGGLHWAVLLLPLYLLPLLLYVLALGWLLGALSVYLRDIGHLAPSFSSLLLFLTPIFYPASMVPASLRWMVDLNPLAWAAEAARSVLLNGTAAPWEGWGMHLVVSCTLATMGWAFFQRVKPGFADVL